ncbi:Similar to hypothetical protein [Tuber melanosporum Mel28]; acc. no. XP_002835367 [Pyronema omphalodes CBS 100304]|uniref:VWFA domain-containing protein n=1 Tax=Pyronema omphalodes (strain CBS 100304) TaxID=1076935 RepID=U4KZB0_PYROM|nr:Similar to hypothetical protein [Tuber melanosporum Mel28]; acc. no. XP_002835367 [Pyronema omphalodes CBS 100304]
MAENDTADKPDAAGATDEKADISGIDAEFCQKKLRQFTEQKQKIKLKDFFTDEKLKALSPTALAMFKSLIDDGCSVERALKFMALTMYYIVVLIDNSDSMAFEENDYTYAREKGIVAIRLLNHEKKAKVEKLMPMIKYDGISMIGTQLEAKILKHYIYEPAKLEKPLLVVTITDGDGGKEDVLRKTLMACVSEMQSGQKKSEMGGNAVAFYFARVGNNKKAADLIQRLDKDKDIGDWLDVFPDRLEEINDEATKWDVLAKLLLGVLYHDIDKQDENAAKDDGTADAPKVDQDSSTDDDDDFNLE